MGNIAEPVPEPGTCSTEHGGCGKQALIHPHLSVCMTCFTAAALVFHKAMGWDR